MPVDFTGGQGGRSWTLGTGGQSEHQALVGKRSLADEAGEVEEDGERIPDEGCFMSIGQAEPGRALQVAVRLGSIAGLGIALAAQTQLPGGGVHLKIPGQADLATVGGIFGESETNGSDKSEGVSGVLEASRSGVEKCLRRPGGSISGGKPTW
jgi:hypothetical protein